MLCFIPLTVEVSKKIKKPIKPRKPEKTNNWKNQTVKKNLLKFWKKLTGSVRFWFYKPETEPNRTKPKPKNTGKTEPNREKPSQTGKKPSQTGKTEPNQFFSQNNWTKPKPVGLHRFRNRFWLLFFDKNRTEPKIIALNWTSQIFLM